MYGAQLMCECMGHNGCVCVCVTYNVGLWKQIMFEYSCRSVEDSVCEALMEFEKFSLSLSLSHTHTHTHTHRVPKNYGIFSFTPYPHLIEGAVSPSSLQVVPDHRKRAIVVSEDKRSMFVTSSGGQEWLREALPSTQFDEADDLFISEVAPDHMILVAENEVSHAP